MFTQACPTWSIWGLFDDCSMTCGGGSQTRTRTCLNGEPGDIGCDVGATDDVSSCNQQACPAWANWGEFGECSLTCAGGVQTRTRECENGDVGDIGCPAGGHEEDRTCNEQVSSIFINVKERLTFYHLLVLRV